MTIRLNAEWSHQSGVMLAWPHRHSDWRANLSEAERVFCELARHITRFEQLLIIYRDPEHLAQIKERLASQPLQWQQIRWCQAPSNDSWARDFGPITVTINGQPTLLNFTFNGWGNKYPAELDNQITRRVYDNGCFARIPLTSPDFILEGGAIDCDGDGSLLTTRHCLLAPTRNPHLDQAGIEAVLAETLGIDRVLWLAHGELSGDDTDSHIDMLARFCSHDTIAYSHCDDAEDSHFQPLQAMQKELEQLRRKDGSPYHLVPLLLPRAQFDEGGQRLPASYANFLIINGAVLVPVYNDPADTIAVQRLQACFPEREIVSINCLALIHQYGSLHCITMQLPEGVL
jgi:agmatine/peptidylarginine deiminase